MNEDRTEPPSPRRLSEARKQGQVARSVELSSAVALLVGFWILSSSGPRLVTAMRTLIERGLERLTEGDITMSTLQSGMLTAGQLVMQALAPLILAMVGVAIGVNVAQTRGLVSLHLIKPDLGKINPISGFKRLFSMRGFVQLLKSLAKLAVVGLVVYQAISANLDLMLATSRMTLSAGLGQIAQLALTIGLRVALVMLVLAVLDYVYQRRQFYKSLRMTKQEVKEEAKLQENPELRGRIRQRMREVAIRRMMAAIPKADVVITNPTHLAVALRYDKDKMQAPQVVAKGQRLIAERIKELARQHGVPLIENKPLAQALYQSVEIGQEIPVSLYQAVAEVLAFVYRLKRGSRPSSPDQSIPTARPQPLIRLQSGLLADH
jgi:flagellar biosynthetic protein FlhB